MLDSERLVALMRQYSLSQSELARRAQLSQATIAKLCTGKAYGSKHLHVIARELHTTPAYLMGETDDPHSDGDPVVLTSTQREWLELLEAVQPKDRAAALHILRTLASRHHRPDPEQSAP